MSRWIKAYFQADYGRQVKKSQAGDRTTELLNMPYEGRNIPFDLLLANEQTRCYLFDLLRRNGYEPRLRIGLDDLLSAIKGRRATVVFLDSETITIYGVGIFQKIKAAAPSNRMILLCDQAHRRLIKEAMDCGSYGCILEPYAEWEILTLVRHSLSDMKSRRRKPGVSRKKS
jgi:DNA-binding NtrC family response regulator